MKWIRYTFIFTLSATLLTFVSLVVYANLEEPTLGEKIYFDNPTQIAVFTIDDHCEEHEQEKITSQSKTLPSVYSQVYTSDSKTLCITFDPRETCRETIMSSVKDLSNQISARTDLNNRPECPVDHTIIKKVLYTLNFR